MKYILSKFLVIVLLTCATFVIYLAYLNAFPSIVDMSDVPAWFDTPMRIGFFIHAAITLVGVFWIVAIVLAFIRIIWWRVQSDATRCSMKD